MSDNPLSPCLAVITILKGMIGAGILALPFVFGKVGLLLAVPGYLVVTATCAFSIWQLIQCKLYLPVQKDASKNECEHDDLGLGPLGLVGRLALGNFGLALAGFGILVSQFGICVAYIDVVVATLNQPDFLGWSCPRVVLRICIFFILCILCMLRSLASISKLSGAALFIYAYLFFALIRWGVQAMREGNAPDPTEQWQSVQWRAIGLWFGTAIFAQEAIVICQYVYDDMNLSKPREFLPVLIASFVICGILSVIIGGFGFMSFGSSTEDVFYLNFPKDSIDTKIAEIILCIVLLNSFVLQAYPIFSFLESVCRSKLEDSSSSDSDGFFSKQNMISFLLLRWGFVAFASVFAAFITNVSCVSGYSGSFAMSIIGFFLPAMCHAKLRQFHLSPLEWCQNIWLLTCGVAAIVFGCLTTSC